MSKVPAKNSNIIKSDESYRGLLNELQSILEKGQNRAYKAVDNIKVQTYWQIGERIVREEIRNKERAEYGKQLVNSISDDIGINKRELYRIIRFYKQYAIVGSLTPQLSWTHYSVLVDIDEKQKRDFYQSKAIANSWSVRELKKQISDRLFENTLDDKTALTNSRTLPSAKNNEIFKRNYDLGFNGGFSNEKDTIGLIICSDAGFEEVQYALGGLEEKIFIATYKSKLPSIEQLKKAVRNAGK